MENVIKKDKIYILNEVVTPSTPKEFAVLGRNRAPGIASEQVKRIPYDTERKMHDLGLNIRSREFVGKSKEEIEEILEGRKDIIEAFQYQLNVNVSSLDNNDEILDSYRINTAHGKVFDTNEYKSLIDIWVLFYSKKASFTEELQRTGAEYELVEDGAMQDLESQFIEASSEANSLFLNLVKSKKQQAVNILYVLKEQRINVETRDAELITIFKKYSESREIDSYNGKNDFRYNIALKIVKEDVETIELKATIISNLKNFENTKDGYFFRDKNIGKDKNEMEKYFANNNEMREHLYNLKQK